MARNVVRTTEQRLALRARCVALLRADPELTAGQLAQRLGVGVTVIQGWAREAGLAPASARGTYLRAREIQGKYGSDWRDQAVQAFAARDGRKKRGFGG